MKQPGYNGTFRFLVKFSNHFIKIIGGLRLIVSHYLIFPEIFYISRGLEKMIIFKTKKLKCIEMRCEGLNFLWKVNYFQHKNNKLNENFVNSR